MNSEYRWQDDSAMNMKGKNMGAGRSGEKESKE